MRFSISAFVTSLAASCIVQQAAAAPVNAIDSVNIEPSASNADFHHPEPYKGDAHLDRIVKRTKPPSHTDQLSWDDAVSTGKRNIAKLANHGTPTKYASFKEHYHEGDLEGNGKYKRKEKAMSQEYWPESVLKELGVEKTDKYISISVFSNKQLSANMKVQKPVGQNGYIADKGIILAQSNFKNQDYNHANEQLPPAETMLQVWDEVAGNKKSDLNWIVRSHIVNEGTRGIINEAFTKLKKDDKDLLHVTEAENLEIFEALSGTPNCKGVYPTLANHESTTSTSVTDLYVSKESGQYFILMKLGSGS